MSTDKELEYEHLTDLVAGEIDRQLRGRSDVLEAMKAQMSKVLQEFEDMSWNVSAKRSWMRSVGKQQRDIHPTHPAVPIHPLVTAGNIANGAGSPPKLPKLSGLKARKRLQQQLNRNVSGTLPPAEGVPSDARNHEGKISFDKKLPRVATIDKRVDGLQTLLAMQQKQLMHEKALVRYPQCRSNVFYPSSYDEASETAQSAPRTSLELDFVYGVHNGASINFSQTNAMSANCNISGNVVYLSTGEVMWFAASIVVLYSKESNRQRYFREHTAEVTSISLHPNQHIVASGQAGRETFILVWDAIDDELGKRFACLKGHTVAVRSINFSHDGKLVASLGGDMFNTICIHDWREQSLLVTARGHSFRVHTVAFNPYQAYGRPESKKAKKPGQALHDDDVCYTLVSCGVRHIRFWTLTKTEYVPPATDENEQSAFYGSAFGGPTRLRPPTPHEKTWKLEGNVPSFHGRLDVQDFITVTFVDDSPPLYAYDERAKELVATNSNDHSLGRIIAGTAKGDLCVFWQPRKSPEIEDKDSNNTKEPAKWWEIPDEYTDAEINELVMEKIGYEPTARLVELVPHDQDTGNRFKLSKQAQVEIDGIQKRLHLKPNSSSLHARLAELKYGGPLGHQGSIHQVAFCKKNNLIISAGADGRLVLWKCHMTQMVRVPGVNTQGIFTPLSGTLSEGAHTLTPADSETRVYRLPSSLPGENQAIPVPQQRPTSVAWRSDGKKVIVGTSTNNIWELDIGSGDWVLIFEARSGSITACSSHPGREEIATVSTDGYLSIWDVRRHQCRRRLHLSFGAGGGGSGKPTCMDFDPHGDVIAVGLSNGELIIVEYHELRVRRKKFIKAHASDMIGVAGISSPPPISQVKFDPHGKVLAVGARDTFIYLYNVENDFKKLHVCEGHSCTISQLTWSVDGDVLQSNASDGEVLFWSVSLIPQSIKQVTDAFLMRDVQWTKWTCIFGWATAGIWADESSSLTDIGAVATSGSQRIRLDDAPDDDERIQEKEEDFESGEGKEPLVAVANRNTLRLLRWPATRGSKAKSYHGHSSLITSLCFSLNDRFVLTVGGEDGTLLQWRCEVSTLSTPRSVETRRLQHRNKFPQLSTDDDSGDGSIPGTTSGPTPPPAGTRTLAAQSSPRRTSRQYRGSGGQQAAMAETLMAEGDSDESEVALAMAAGARSAESSVVARCRVVHDFTPENADELGLKAGEIIRVLARESPDWWLGESCDGTRGIFPVTYVVELTGPDDGEEAATAAATPAAAAAAEVETGAQPPTAMAREAMEEEEEVVVAAANDDGGAAQDDTAE